MIFHLSILCQEPGCTVDYHESDLGDCLHLKCSPVEYTLRSLLRLVKGELEGTRTEEGWSREGITKSRLDLQEECNET